VMVTLSPSVGLPGDCATLVMVGGLLNTFTVAVAVLFRPVATTHWPAVWLSWTVGGPWAAIDTE